MVSFGMVLVKINILRLLIPVDIKWKILMGNVKSVKIRHHVLAVGVTNPESSAEAKCDRPKLLLEKHHREERTHSSTWIEVGFIRF